MLKNLFIAYVFLLAVLSCSNSNNSTNPSENADFSGDWTITHTENKEEAEHLHIVQNGDNVSGYLSESAISGSVEGDEIIFSFSPEEGEINTCTGTLNGDTITGTWLNQNNTESGTWTATRGWQEICDTPTFTPPAGTYTTAQSVSISCSTSGATIRYATNGSEPTSSSAIYSTPLNISATTTLKAKAFKDGWTASETATAQYAISDLTPGMIFVQGGTFLMGDHYNEGFSNELPTHNVTVSSFYIGQYEVTQGEYQAIIGNNLVYDYGVGSNYPVYYVSWYDAVAYCNALSTAEGLTPCYSGSGTSITCDWNANGYRLPTEAEWEYAARGGTASDNADYRYSGSDDIGTVA